MQNACVINKEGKHPHVSVPISQTVHCKAFAAYPAHIFGLLTFICIYFLNGGTLLCILFPALVLAESFKRKQHPLASKHLLNVTIVLAG